VYIPVKTVPLVVSKGGTLIKLTQEEKRFEKLVTVDVSN
jgi:hypothetical protein